MSETPWTRRPPHLQRYVDKRNGRTRIYFRKEGARKIELKAPWGSQALADEAAAIAATIKPRPAPAIGTLSAAVRAYRDSADFCTLAPATQKEYERWLARFEFAFAGVLLEDVDAGYVLALRDKWATRGYRAANHALQVLKNVCKGPRIRGEIAGDPFALIEKVQRPHALGEKNPRWLDDEVEAVIEWAIEKKLPGLARAVALGRWGGFRKQTIASVPRRARIVREGERGPERRLYWVTEKKLVLCDRREDPRLTALLARTEQGQQQQENTAKRRRNGAVAALTIAYNSRGEPWKSRALGHALERAIKALAKAGKVRANLTWHGLRHARGVELALAGGADAEIMSQLDHATPRAAAIYRRQAERLKLADGAQDKVDAEIIKLAARRRERGQQQQS